MAITKKNFIDNSIFKELEEKYPPVESENGVAYKQKLDYLTFETDFLTSPTIRMLRNQHGAVVIAVICLPSATTAAPVRVDSSIILVVSNFVAA